MKIVRISRDMRPWRAGQDAVLSDELAEKLIKSGEAENPRPYPPADVTAPRKEDRPTIHLPRAKPYFTRKREAKT